MIKSKLAKAVLGLSWVLIFSPPAMAGELQCKSADGKTFTFVVERDSNKENESPFDPYNYYIMKIYLDGELRLTESVYKKTNQQKIIAHDPIYFGETVLLRIIYQDDYVGANLHSQTRIFPSIEMKCGDAIALQQKPFR